jgi:hypothetical protein
MEICLDRFVVSGYEWCSVDKLGNIYSSRSGLPYKPYTTKSGYKEVCTKVCGAIVHVRVHRAVAIVFIENPNNYDQVNHINGVKYDNSAHNLEWSNASLQQYHAGDMGLSPVGIDSHFCKYPEEKIHSICRLLDMKIRVCDIAKSLNIHRKVVCDIKHGKSWYRIAETYNFLNKDHQRLAERRSAKWCETGDTLYG